MEILQASLPLLVFIAVWLGINWYVGKKARTHQAALQVDDARPPGCITLIRGIEMTNYLRAYDVFIDNRWEGNIAAGETRHFPLAPGEHQVMLKLDWCRSRTMAVEMNRNRNVSLHCGAKYNNWKVLFTVLLKPHDWLYLTTEPPQKKDIS